ncbi:hypothetical protein [Pseudonocardia sp. GCM10023141]|uniref:hypothetical protein n=1 Tax=Pseudonocardia sp. GCM10023141 TaxID=3252653 RepID=UPI003609035A
MDAVRPGWWVFSYGARGGSWGHVDATTSHVDGRGRTVVRLTVTEPGTGSEVEIENVAGYPATCVTAAQARTAGLRL